MIVESAPTRIEHLKEESLIPPTVKPWIVTDLTCFSGRFETEEQALDYLTKRMVLNDGEGCHIYHEEELSPLIKKFREENPDRVSYPSTKEDGSLDYNNLQIRYIAHAQSDQ